MLTPGIIIGGLLCTGVPAPAEDFTAEKVMNAMSPEQRSAYLAGVIEGLAIARYNKDGQKTDGMGCIYDWFYKDKPFRAIYDAFDKFPTYLPGTIIHALAKRKCGE